MLTVFGTVALDTTRTPFRTETRILGGAATFASLSSSMFAQTSIVAVVGSDMPADHIRAIRSKGIDTKGIVTVQGGKTFHYDSSFDYDLSNRTTNKTELGVIAGFDPVIPEEYAKSDYVYLANNDPKQNIKILQHFQNPKLVVCDTIEFWINGSRDDVIKMVGMADGVVINDNEARLLCKEANIAKCAKKIMSWGSKFAIIKKGEHGAILFTSDNQVFPAAAFFLDEIVDPTGAGDSFAGGFLGHIARRNRSDFATMKEAVIYGNVMGSFAVEDFGVKRLLSITKDDVEERYKKYRNLVQF
ncbi:PfkB domain protein [Candidatus Nitrososphaera gargensis Ga9.2]|uniref:PfkB domain protein n=1 Tax=Nitrososphaera gargensis (strain Ga9.2) TaxID=1237085 RepID=K0IMK2_NITGG|nr:PfkB family carbohydrate kinase [Candidatus Nitrososphaera gargensis]AFU60362.1 PfkB domain protein [Candidatus Nitrososphaera gargensis Ga9.2]